MASTRTTTASCSRPRWSFADGQRLYADTFSQYGALPHYLHALALLVFGKNLLSIRLMSVLMYAVAAGFLVSVWRTFLPLSLTALTLVFFLAFAPDHSVSTIALPWTSIDALAYQSAATFFLLRALRPTRSPASEVLCGVATAFAFLSRTPVGVFLFGAVVSVLVLVAVKERFRRPAFMRLAFVVAGFGAVLALFILYLALSGAVRDWVTQVFEWPSAWIKHHGIGAKRVFASLVLNVPDYHPPEWLKFLPVVLAPLAAIHLWDRGSVHRNLRYISISLAAAFLAGSLLFLLRTPCLVNDIHGWAPMLPWLIVAGAGVVLVVVLRIPSSDAAFSSRAKLLSVTAIAASSWTQYYPVSDARHVFWAIAPMLGAFVILALYLCRDRARLLLVALTILVAPLVVKRVQLASAKLGANYTVLTDDSIVHGSRMSPTDVFKVVPVKDAIAAYLKTRPDAPILNIGTDPLYTAMAKNLKNAHPVHVDWIMLSWGRDYHERERQFIVKERPLIIIQPMNPGVIDRIMKNYPYRVHFDYRQAGILVLAPTDR